MSKLKNFSIPIRVSLPDDWAEQIVERLRNDPDAEWEEVTRCKDCKHYEQDHWEKVNGIPLIVANEICTKWGNGCKTDPDGYCFMGEKMEVKHERPDNSP